MAKALFFEIEAEVPTEREQILKKLDTVDVDIARLVRELLKDQPCANLDLRRPCWSLLGSFDSMTDQTGIPTFAPGCIVDGRFEVLRFIAEGGMGEVYAARELNLCQDVALKTIRSSVADQPGVIERFKSEVKQSLRTTHPNVCRVHQLACHEDNDGRRIWFLTMELLEGQTLSSYLAENGPIAWEHALPLIKQMISGLSSAHQLGIVHRDLKPSNIMIVDEKSSNERLKIMDFGLAISVSDDETRENVGRFSGTPAYRAPEQQSGAAVGPQADLFALGLIIGELLTGDRLPQERSSSETWHTQVDAWLLSHAKIDARARSLIRCCLKFDPVDRFKDARELLTFLEANKRLLTLERLIVIVVTLGAAITLSHLFVKSPGEEIVDASQLTPHNIVSARPSLSANGKYLAYMSTRADPANLDIWFQLLPGGVPRRLTNSPSADTDPSVSPDGTLVAFRSERSGGGIFLVRTDGTGERLLVPGGRDPAFSLDGSRIAYWLGPEDSLKSGALYLYSLKDESSRRLVTDFADARRPAWSSDGRSLLFLGTKSNITSPEKGQDWWQVNENGTSRYATGALPLIHNEGIEPDFQAKPAMWGNHLFFSGRRGQWFQIWSIPISDTGLRDVRRPFQITHGSVDEKDPIVAQDGQIATVEVTGALHIWRVPVQGTNPNTEPEKLTDGLGLDCCPAAVGRIPWVFFTRKIGNFRQLMKLNVHSGQDSVVYTSDEDKLAPLPDSTGKIVVFESRKQNRSAIWVWDGHDARALCEGCSHPSSWITDGKDFLYTSENGDIARLDIVTGSSQVILAADSQYVLGDPDWTSVNEHLLFTALMHGAKQLFAVRLPAKTKKAIGPWIPLAAKSTSPDLPHWSEDGSAFYYFSASDGFYCLWGARFDPLNEVASEPVAIHHYHNWGQTPRRAFGYLRGLTEKNSWIYTDVGEMSATVWCGRIHRDRVRTFFRDAFGH